MPYLMICIFSLCNNEKRLNKYNCNYNFLEQFLSLIANMKTAFDSHPQFFHNFKLNMQ